MHTMSAGVSVGEQDARDAMSGYGDDAGVYEYFVDAFELDVARE